jgi:hypothetical protein
MQARRLSEDARDDLNDVLASPGLKPLLLELEALVEAKEAEVLKYKLEDERKLVHLKLSAEGARALFDAFKRRVDTLKAKQKA